ncbi:vascular-related unknown protein 4 [Cajanus cajan]|uniref:Uncharacterized protein n=1 Tax=Cajanus cajan TaxID=3821 RepID=A0A151RDX3_CAJCA|nr:vascular-related unknown protein 4 [Cajanus cajan]KYP40731.1 hypothetical protein KK1_037907 [Cajanus cajan]
MSTKIKAPSSTSECDSSEESGWTKYFEDFFNDHNVDDQKCSMSFSGIDSTSFASDAASLAATKKLTYSTQAEESSLKKRKKIKTAFDDALEDTASSPIKGPKEKGNTSGERDERKEVYFNGRDNDHAELKKKGLCLVPLSMIVKYL